MLKNSVRAALLGAVSGVLCMIVPNGSYNGTQIAIYQHPFNITVFYLIFFAVQSDHIYEPAFYDIRFEKLAAARAHRFIRMTKSELVYIAAYFSCSCTVSYIYTSESSALFSVISFLVTSVLNLAVLNIFFVNVNTGKSAVFFAEAGMILCGLALCFAAPSIVPYVCIWYYGVYPEPAVNPFLSLLVYIMHTAAALLTGFIPRKYIEGVNERI